MKESLITKRVTFRIFATVFTPAYNALFHDVKETMGPLVMNHLITSAAMSVGLVRNFFYYIFQKFEKN